MNGAAVSSFLIAPGGALRGRLRVPGDKSISHRAIMLGALAEGETRVSGFLEGEDSLATLAAFRAMGVSIQGPREGRLVIQGRGLWGLRAPTSPLDLGNSGTSMRLLSGLLAGQGFPVTLVGDESLSRRPMRRVTEPLALMGANIETSSTGTAPLRILPVAGLKPIDYALPVASAQVKSCVLLAGLFARGRTCVTEPAPTRDHTERMLAGFGYALGRQGARICLEGGGRLRACDLDVPADISSAAFFLVGASIAPGSDLILEHVGMNPTRIGVLNILWAMGADIEVLNPRDAGGEPVADLRVRSAPLHGIRIPEDQVPLAIDEFPALFIAAACAAGETLLTGAEELRVKETDRIQVMADGLSALGIINQPRPDGILIRGGTLQGGRVDSRGDHRIAMSFAVAALRAAASIQIRDCANVRTSFPGFVAQAASVGLAIREDAIPEITAPEYVPQAKAPLDQGFQGKAIPVVTIDGPSGTGKGTIASLLASHLGWACLDTGALYRVLGLAATRAGLDLADGEGLARLAAGLELGFSTGRVLLGGEDVSAAIRTETAANAASKVAALEPVRAALLAWQRAAARPPGLVADGRDMGTVVFPEALVKIFLTASPEERARRRYRQLQEQGLRVDLARLVEEIAERDTRDAQRAVAPLRPAADALLVDTTGLGIEAVLARVLEAVQGRLDLPGA